MRHLRGQEHVLLSLSGGALDVEEVPLAEPDPRLLKLVPTVARLVAGEIDQDPDRAIKGSAMREPDDRNVIRLIRELDAERTARKKAERHVSYSKPTPSA